MEPDEGGTSGEVIEPDLRVLTEHPGGPASVRHAILTFVHDFSRLKPVVFNLVKRAKTQPHSTYGLSEGAFAGSIGDLVIAVDGEHVTVLREEKTVVVATCSSSLIGEL